VEARKDNKVIFTGLIQQGLVCLDLEPVQRPKAYTAAATHDTLAIPQAIATESTAIPQAVATQLPAPQSAIPTEATESKINLWHRRLGHISLKAVEQLAETSAVNRIDISGLREPKQPGDQACTGCLAGKIHESFHKTTDTRATRPLERIHADISGIKSKSSRGNRYFLLFVDDYLRHY